MTERAYTVSELDALRRAVENKWTFGRYDPMPAGHGGMIVGRGYQEHEKTRCVEELVRTHMVAGHTAEDLYASERITPKHPSCELTDKHAAIKSHGIKTCPDCGAGL